MFYWKVNVFTFVLNVCLILSVGPVNVQKLPVGTLAQTHAGPHVQRSGSLCETASFT